MSTKNPGTHLFKMIVGAVILLNAALFAYVNTTPIGWRHNEITHFNFLWSKSLDKGAPEDNLRTGLHADDFQKIFLYRETENHLRFRQFSNLCEMIFFKFWQALNIQTFHNNSIIVLHVLNSFLIYVLMQRLTGSMITSTACALFFLNSGIALSTMLFPCRIPKILLITVFLSAWLTGEGMGKPNATRFRWMAFHFLLLLMVFTDEMALVLIPLMYLLMSRNGSNGVTRRKSIVGLATVVMLYGLMRGLATMAAVHMGYTGDSLDFREIKLLIHKVPQTAFLADTLRAFFSYFSRRHFGYWDLSFFGGLSAVTFFVLLGILWRRASKNALGSFCIIVAFILIKSIGFPHPYGVHTYIMGWGTSFPSLLFFNYYYTYVDSCLIVIALGYLMGQLPGKKTKTGIFLLLVVLIVNASNGFHAQEGIKDAVNQHSYYKTGQRNIPKIVGIQRIKQLAGNAPVYLSFPSGSLPVFSRYLSSESNVWEKDPEAKHQQLFPDFIDYNSIVLVQYLKMIEERQLIVSLRNVPSMRSFAEGEEICAAHYFYDVHKNIWQDLNALHTAGKAKEVFGEVSKGRNIEKNMDMPADVRNARLIFFVKGGSFVHVHIGSKTISLRQNYGYAYQIFRIALDSCKPSPSDKIKVLITAADDRTPVTLWGPFIE